MLNNCVDLSPGIYMSSAFVWINTAAIIIICSMHDNSIGSNLIVPPIHHTSMVDGCGHNLDDT